MHLKKEGEQKSIYRSVIRSKVVVMEPLTVGTLLLWHANKGYGIIQGPTSHRERYFLHISQIDELPDFRPEVGTKFSFSIARPRKDGELPRAMSAKVVVAPGVAEVL